MKTETILYNYSFCILEAHSTEMYNFSPRRAIYSFADFTGYYLRNARLHLEKPPNDYSDDNEIFTYSTVIVHLSFILFCKQENGNMVKWL